MAEHQNNLLWKKCEAGKLEEAREAVQAGADPNTRLFNYTCLMTAAEENHDEVVALLLAHPNIQVNAKNQWNSTALHLACANDSLASLSKLLAAPGLQLNERDVSGWTPIMVAIRWGKTEAVLQMAAVRGVDLDVKDNDGRSLEEIKNSWTIESARPAIVQILEEARQRRRLVREQKAKVLKVLLDGLHDPDSAINTLRMPIVKSPLMKRIWDLVTEDWQVYNEGGSADEAP